MRTRCTWLVFALAPFVFAQDRIATMPGYETFLKNSGTIRNAVKYGRVTVEWSEDGRRAYFQKGNQWMQVDLANGRTTSVDEPKDRWNPSSQGGRRTGRGGFTRGRQVTIEPSPDGAMRAVYREGNVWLTDGQGNNGIQVTTEGNLAKRIKYGSASWVYGEELNQNDAMWWSPDSKKLAFYRFDESMVPDYFLTTKIADFQNVLYPEAYAKAGAANPEVELFVYDLGSKTTTKVDVRGGKPFENGVVGHYVYAIQWSPNGKELLFNRTNRQQNILEFCAADPATGAVRTILREDWSQTWTDNRPFVQWLNDGKRFIWKSERRGFYNFELWELAGRKIADLTQHRTFEVANLVRVDEATGDVFYTAWSGSTPHMLQLHRTTLTGTGDRRITDPAFAHSGFALSPKGDYVRVLSSNSETPDFTSLVRTRDGQSLAVLEQGDLTEFRRLGGQTVETFTFTAADGQTRLWGKLHKPSQFDPNRKYPVLVSVYNGPDSAAITERFEVPNSLCEFGFVVLEVESRGGDHRGKAFKDAAYRKLGVVEIDDIAAGVRAALNRGFLDASRVGIFGTSYGGYASIMCLLRYPDLFHAACAGSPVTDWRHYDTIYTERYMWIPQENADGYRAGSAITYAKDKKGFLMMVLGTADDNVHPANAYQLINALRAARKSYELQVVPDGGHLGPDRDRMMEFFIERLVMR